VDRFGGKTDTPASGGIRGHLVERKEACEMTGCKRSTIYVLLFLIICPLVAFAASNRHGAKVSAVSTQNIGMAHHVQAKNRGYKVTLAISPYAAARSYNGHGHRVIIGPSAVVQHAAALARARTWMLYE